LLVEQNAAAALNLAHYAYILETGRLVLEGPGAELLAHPRLKDAYLGEDSWDESINPCQPSER